MTTVTSAPAQDRNSLQPSRTQAYYAFIVLLIINVLNYTDRYILAAVQTTIQAEFRLTDTELGLLNSAFLLIYAIATLPLGVWADRSARKNIVALCVSVWSIATTLGGFTRNFFQLLIVRSVLGVGEAGYAPASLSLLGDYFPKSQRGRILATWSVSNLIGTALGLIMGGIIADALGWRWAFYLVGIPGLAAAFLIWRAHEPARGVFDSEEARETADEKAATQTHGGIGKDFWSVVGQLRTIPTYWLLLAAFVFSFFTIGSASTWINTYLIRDFTLSPGQAGAIAGGVLAGGSLVGTLAGGWLADYMQRRRPQGRMLVATFAFLAGAPLTFIALSIHSLLPFIVVFLLSIICLSLCLGPLNATIQDVVLPEIRATAIGLVLLLAHLLGDAASPLIVGAIAEHFKTLGADPARSLGLALLITGPTCLFIAGVICLFGLRTVASDMRAMQAQLSRR